MPIYEYRCSKCGKTFEKIQKFVDPPVEVHEECGGPVERLISTSALQFKGSGFYITDYKGASKSESKSEHAGGSGHEGGGGESKTDSKGEGKSESKSESRSESKSESRSSESHGSKSSGSGDSKSSESQSSKSSKPAPATKSD